MSEGLSNLDVALDLARCGISIFPCQGYGDDKARKRPCTRVSWRSEATTDEKKIRSWWRRFPDAVPAIELGKNGLIVVDCDCKIGDGLAWLTKHVATRGESLDECPATDTPSGGRHLYYRNTFDPPKGNVRGRLPDKKIADIDIKGDGGYVIAPGATFDDGSSYRLHGSLLDAKPPPPWLVELLSEPDRPAPIAFTVPSVASDTSAYGEAAMRGEIDRVAAAPDGDRNNTLNSAVFSLGQLVPHILPRGEVERAMEAAALAAGLQVKETRATIRSALPAGMAKPRGPADDPTPYVHVLVNGHDLVDSETGEVLEESTSTKFGETQENDIDTATVSLEAWLVREFAPLKPLLGDLLTTTTRAQLSAPTGLGKTNICLQIAMHMAAVTSRSFLCWQCSGGARVLYIDGEMSGRLFKQRLADAAERLGEVPDTFFALSCADIEDFAPLNTKEGQAAIERLMARIGGVDFVFFDSVMCLIDGDMKDEESWQQTLPWIRSLTRRHIGQLWVHHTGHDETHGYGTKTREWQLDVVMLLERVERDDTDVSFSINFQKARERTPDNRKDFNPVKIWLVDDKWHYESAIIERKISSVSPETEKFFGALELATRENDAIDDTKIFGFPIANLHAWQEKCYSIGLLDHEKPHSSRTLLSRHKLRLISANWIMCDEYRAWIIK